MKFTIGICTFNRNDILKRTLDSIIDWIPHEKIQLIIADNNSTDDTKNTVLKFIDSNSKIEVLYLPVIQQGLSHARNIVLDNAKYNYVIFLDDDAVLCSDIVAEYEAAVVNNPNCHIFGGRVIKDDKTIIPTWFSKEFYMLYSLLDIGSDTIPFPSKLGPIGANLLVNTDKINGLRFRTDLGRVGNNLASGEETDFLYRIGFNRDNSLYVGKAKVYHCFPECRYTKEWAYERFKYNGISNRKLRVTKYTILYGFLSECFQFFKSFKSLNPTYIKSRFYSLFFYIKGS